LEVDELQFGKDERVAIEEDGLFNEEDAGISKGLRVFVAT
jgi:hypothetical protein